MPRQDNLFSLLTAVGNFKPGWHAEIRRADDTHDIRALQAGMFLDFAADLMNKAGELVQDYDDLAEVIPTAEAIQRLRQRAVDLRNIAKK
jgi:hypothetical protein